MKVVGYIVAIIGMIGVLLKVDFVKKFLGFTLPAVTQSTYFMIGSVIVVIIGLALVMMGGNRMGSSRRGGEVPIYAGNQIVGYRRV